GRQAGDADQVVDLDFLDAGVPVGARAGLIPEVPAGELFHPQRCGLDGELAFEVVLRVGDADTALEFLDAGVEVPGPGLQRPRSRDDIGCGAGADPHIRPQAVSRAGDVEGVHAGAGAGDGAGVVGVGGLRAGRVGDYQRHRGRVGRGAGHRP